MIEGSSTGLFTKDGCFMPGLSGDSTFVGALPVQELGLRFANNAAITFPRAYLLVIVKSDKMSFECGAIVQSDVSDDSPA